MGYINQINFQDPISISFDNICFLHHFVLMFLICILLFVLYFLIICLNIIITLVFNIEKKIYNFYSSKIFITSSKFVHESRIELIWTIIPTLIISILLFPSFNLLYIITESFYSELNVKVIGHQWFWSYEYKVDLSCLIFDLLSKKFEQLCWFKGFSYNLLNFIEEIIAKLPDLWIKFDSSLLMDLPKIILRLLETDNFLIIPIKIFIHFLVTSDDVIHSFSVSNLGLKMDCIPGRINEILIFLKRNGFFVGQCSEICGVNHAYMPINILGISYSDFIILLYKIFNENTIYNL